jgi:hypothetical protein
MEHASINHRNLQMQLFCNYFGTTCRQKGAPKQTARVWDGLVERIAPRLCLPAQQARMIACLMFAGLSPDAYGIYSTV